MNFVVFDITLLVLFVLVASIFLYRGRRNLKKEGWLLLYKTKWGIKLIEYIGGKYHRTLKVLSYVSIGLGYVLMAGMLYLVIRTVHIYLTTSISSVVRAPPIAPLIPYFPKLFGLESFFPPFYFVYFILAILIVATVHEFSHGIFARRHGIRIKSTGFAFLKYFPAFFGAFVEQDDEQMNKKGKFEQMSILSAGVFANVLVTILFYILLVLFFSFAFTASGVMFDSYPYSVLGVSGISMINGVSIDDISYNNVLSLIEEEGFSKVTIKDKNYLINKDLLENSNGKLLFEEGGKIALFDDAPAINAKLTGVILSINEVVIDSREKLGDELMKYSPGDEIIINAKTGKGIEGYKIVLGQNPNDENIPWLGIGFFSNEEGGVMGSIFNLVSSYKKPNVYYEPKYELSVFITDLIWWIVIINLLVAMFNMMPIGILDGGRFFYLTILGITKSEKIAKRSFSVIGYLMLLALVALMIKWGMGFFN
ncbi:MAG: site-2 protease family protein [archaeon]